VPDLRLVLRGWIGDRREALEAKATYAFRRLLEKGPDPSLDDAFGELAFGQAQVAAAVQGATGRGAAGLEAEDQYWEHYGHGPAADGREFYVTWLRCRLPAGEAGRLVRLFTTPVRLAGVTAVEPLPLVAWRGGDPRGALVHQVADGSPAARGGLKPGDLVQAVGGQRVRGVSDFDAVFRPLQARARAAGGAVTLSVLRVGEGQVECPVAFPRAAVVTGGPEGAGPGGGIDE
jgi:hypothetical protein